MAKKGQSPKIRKLYIVGSVLIVLGYLALFGFTYPPCAERDIVHDIPPHLQGATIRFESGNIIRWKFKGSFARQCTPLGKQEAGFITNTHITDEIKQGKAYVHPDEGLKLRYIVTRKCQTLRCIDSGGTSLYLLLEDNEGRLWGLLAANNSRLQPVYYQNREQKGALRLQDYFSQDDGLIISRPTLIPTASTSQ